MDSVYKEYRITTPLSKRTLKKLLIDFCTKTPFSLNGELFQQIDGACMGSPLGPILADMTTLEEEVIRPVIFSATIKFYARFVDDTLV